MKVSSHFSNSFWHRIIDPSSFTGRLGWTLGTNIALVGINAATGILSARLLGPHGRGELTAILMWSALIATFATLGMSDAVVYFGSRFPEKAGHYLTSALALILTTSAAFVGLGWLLLPYLLQAQSPAVVSAARIFLVAEVFAVALVSVPHQVLRAVNSWRKWNLLRLLPQLCWLASLLAAFVLPDLANPITLSRFFVGAQLFPIVLLVPFVWRCVSCPYAVHTELFRPLLNFGVPMMVNVLPQFMNLRLDQLVMSTILEPRLLGYYTVAFAWSSVSGNVLNAVGYVLFPRLSAMSNAVERDAFFARIIRLNSVVVVISTGISVLLTPFAVLWLFGQAYREAVPSALILVFANGFYSLNRTLADGLRGLGQPRSVLISEVIGLGITVVLLYLLLPRYSILGAASASLASYAAISVGLFLSVKRVTHLSVVAAPSDASK